MKFLRSEAVSDPTFSSVGAALYVAAALAMSLLPSLVESTLVVGLVYSYNIFIHPILFRSRKSVPKSLAGSFPRHVRWSIPRPSMSLCNDGRRRRSLLALCILIWSSTASHSDYKSSHKYYIFAISLVEYQSLAVDHLRNASHKPHESTWCR